MMSGYSTDALMPDDNDEEVLSRCVVDVFTKKVYLYSNLGSERTVECEDSDEFVNVLELVHSFVSENQLFYSTIIIFSTPSVFINKERI